MDRETEKILNVLQLVFEILIIIGYAIGLIPFGYLVSLWYVIPLTIANVVFSIKTQNGTQPFTITNAIMSVLSIIPIVGYLFRIIGIIMSIISLVKLSELQNITSITNT